MSFGHQDVKNIIKQRSRVKELLNREIVKGDLWYIISFNWWRKWEVYVDSVEKNKVIDETIAEHPGMVDNSDLRDLKLVVMRHLKKEPCKVHLYVSNDNDDLEELKDDDVTIEEASLELEKIIYVELEEKNGFTSSSAMNRLQFNGLRSDAHSSDKLNCRVPGVCGLSNLGNTCFMNSALQCISNVPQLTEYFLSGKWEKELNRRNPLGSQGRIAYAYAELLKQLWSGMNSSAVPREFKIEIARIAHQFSGYAQHDTHELLVFLLDGLHEDLNRIQSKPYIDVKDSEGRPDIEVANESWSYYKSRNDSVIVDLFHGQLKSTVVCPTCQRNSVTFDPFASLILPIQDIFQNKIIVYVWPWDPTPNSDLLRFELVVRSIPNLQSIIEALEYKRAPKKGCVYQMSNKPIERSRCAIIVHELMEGFPIPVIFTDDKYENQITYNSNLNLPIFINIPLTQQEMLGNSFNVCEALLINLLVQRLRVIGLDLVVTHGSGIDSDSFTSTHSVSHTKPSQTSNLSALLKGHIFLKDNRGNEWSYESDEDELSLSPCESYTLVVKYKGLGVREKLYQLYSRINQVYLKLADSFERFVAVEQLGAKDLWYCNRCKSEKQATKKFDLWKLPDVLVIQLKRFKSNSRLHDKIDSFIEFPITGLDLTPLVLNKEPGEKYIYNLIAVNNHTGYLGGGHYTAFALNCRTNRWYHFDDSATKEIDAQKVVTSAAYVLVYLRSKTDRIVSPKGKSDENSFEETKGKKPFSNGHANENVLSKQQQHGILSPNNQYLMDIE